MKSYVKVLSFGILNFLFVHFLYAQNYVNVVDKVGFTYQNPLVEQKATEISLSVNVNPSSIPFKVYSYSLYPVMGCLSGNCGLEASRNRAISQLKQNPYYFGIIKEFYPIGDPESTDVEWKIRFTVLIKLPTGVPGYAEIDELERSAVEIMTQKYLEQIYTEYSGFNLSHAIGKSEEKTLIYFLDLFSSLRNGSQIKPFENSGWEKIDGSSVGWSITAGDAKQNGATGSNNVFHLKFANLQIFNKANPSDLLSFFDEVPEDYGGIFNSYGIILIQSSSQNLPDHFDIERYAKENATDIAIWLHADIVGQENGQPIVDLYMKTYVLDETASFINDEILTITKNNYYDDWGEIYEELGGVRGEISELDRQDKVKDKLLGFLNNDNFLGGMAVGLLGGLIGNLKSIYDSASSVASAGKKVLTGTRTYLTSLWKTAVDAGSLTAAVKKVYNDGTTSIKQAASKLSTIMKALSDLNYQEILAQVEKAVKEWLGEIAKGDKNSGYIVGKIIFEMVMAVTTFGAAQAKVTMSLYKWIDKINSGGLGDMLSSVFDKAKTMGGKVKNLFSKCKILGTGCFVKDTPVLIAGTSHPISLRNTFPAYAMAALPLVSPVPIQDVSLLDYAVTHKSVNSASISESNASYGLTANSEDTYIIDNRKEPSISQDLYTSEEQRLRDQYEIDEDNWHEVAFEEVNGTSTCRLALHNDWIINHGYAVDGIVEMNLPEQGISGPFKITAIKHILPQKKPVDEDTDDEWEYKPVTGLFTHRSDQVQTIAFASADGSQIDTLGVTAAHPIFSTTHHDWRLAGELEAGEKVLTYKGEATVLSNDHKPGNEYVYNLEIKDLHNFLVGDFGVVVHNTCPLQLIRDLIKDATLRIKKINGKLEIPSNWVKNDILKDGKIVGSRYVHPTNNKVQIRVHDQGKLSQYPHNYGKPYGRYELGKDANGVERHADIDGNMVELSDPKYYEKTHFLLEALDVE